MVEKLKSDMIDAMKNKEKEKLTVIRMVRLEWIKSISIVRERLMMNY